MTIIFIFFTLSLQYRVSVNTILATLGLQIAVPLSSAILVVFIYYVRSLVLQEKPSKVHMLVLFSLSLFISGFMFFYVYPAVYNLYVDPILAGSCIGKYYVENTLKGNAMLSVSSSSEGGNVAPTGEPTSSSGLGNTIGTTLDLNNEITERGKILKVDDRILNGITGASNRKELSEYTRQIP